MRLAKLELTGFKSFADTVTFEFGDGVTAIVGPNGCGKSNLSDAVRWVLGEQSARLLRGGKMEDVIFQGSATRRPVNVTEVSLYLDNSDGSLPIAYQEVVITRRLSRSGQSDYLLNNAPVRLRDIQDLLRGTGMGSDAGVVIEARMVDLLLSDRAEERRSLFDEAAGIGLYRDRKVSTERRLEETAADLQRIEDRMAEVESHLRSLARQKGKAERHARLLEEKFQVQVTLAWRRLSELAAQAEGLERRHLELAAQLPEVRREVTAAVAARDARARARADAEAARATMAREHAEAQVALARLKADLSIAAERVAAAELRRQRAREERAALESRGRHAQAEGDAAGAERAAVEREYEAVRRELDGRMAAEAEVRTRLAGERDAVRGLEQEAQGLIQRLRALEGERSALETELRTLRERAEVAVARRQTLQVELAEVERAARAAREVAEERSREAQAAAALADQARLQLAETREREAAERAALRQVEEALALDTARRQALEALERDRVGLAPAAAALLSARDRFDGAVLGPLSDFLSTDPASAELAERLLGDLVHAVLVRSEADVAPILHWHAETQPGALVLLPAVPGPQQLRAAPHPLTGRLRVEGPAAAWVDALVGGSEVLEATGRVLRRPNGAVYLGGASSPTGPLRRRAELARLAGEIARAEHQRAELSAAVVTTQARLAALEQAVGHAADRLVRAREAERAAAGQREDAFRRLATVQRDLEDCDRELAAVETRLADAERRLAEVDAYLTDGEVASARLDQAAAAGRARVSALEAELDAAREARLQWQVQEARLGARLSAATERLERVTRTAAETADAVGALARELGQLDQELAELARQRADWEAQHAAQQDRERALQAALAEAEADLHQATTQLATAEGELADLRTSAELLTEEHHRLELELAQVAATRRSIRERIEAEWRAPLEELLQAAQLLTLDTEALETEAERIAAALDSIGPVNPLAVEEHAEESQRLAFLRSQRDDLAAARQSLLQAIREIDATARALFLETFRAIQQHFTQVFTTLFGGGECELRLSQPEDPLESEIEIHAAPRGKRTQRIHLLSSGERTLVATALLFAIYLTKPSPFCLMDEVDAPLDDANVGRFTTLLHEFKDRTQFIVITHNPRTMQASDTVYGVTMQEPGVSTVVGVQLAGAVAGG